MSTVKLKRAYEKYPYFDEETSADVVIARITEAASPRVREIMTSVVRHLHAVAKETRPTHQEWLQAIMFLTATGHISTEWPQDLSLLSDPLGLTMLIESIN